MAADDVAFSMKIISGLIAVWGGFMLVAYGIAPLLGGQFLPTAIVSYVSMLFYALFLSSEASCIKKSTPNSTTALLLLLAGSVWFLTSLPLLYALPIAVIHALAVRQLLKAIFDNHHSTAPETPNQAL